jgi:hypothetical protein
MPRTFEDIRNTAKSLQSARSPLIRHMMEIRRYYEADWVIPLADSKNEPNMATYIPSLITDTVDGLGMRSASVTPTTHCPAKHNSPTSAARAETRRKIIHATYHRNNWNLKRRRHFRHLCAYDTASIWVKPNFMTGSIELNVRDPLFTFPELMSADAVRPPEYVAYIERYSGDMVRKMYPQTRSERGGPITGVDLDQMWDVFEWVDHEQILYGLMGPVEMTGDHIEDAYLDGSLGVSGPYMQLGPTVQNRAGVCLAVVVQEISLHSMGTRLNGLLGNVDMQARLMALEVDAQQRAIYPDMYALSTEHAQPTISSHGGEWRDGRTGDINLLSGVSQLGQISQTPDVRNQAMIDRLERNTRVSSGLNPQMGGESFGALRTGRALDAMMASSVDPRIQELHDVSATWMSHVNRAITATYKGWWPEQKFEYFSGWPGDRGHVDFTPKNDIESHENVVRYPIPGADVVQLTQILGSMLGAGVISQDTFQTMHPYIDDASQERSTIRREELHEALMAGIQQQIASGQMPTTVVAKLYKRVDGGENLFDALIAIDNELREEQAAAAAAQPPPEDPMAQLGLAAGPLADAPGAGLPPAAGPPPLAPGGPGVDMAQLLAGAMGGQG